VERELSLLRRTTFFIRSLKDRIDKEMTMRKEPKLWMLYLLFFTPAVLFPLILVLDISTSGLLGDRQQAQIIRTPIPTLVPATLPAPMMGVKMALGTAKCSVTAETLLDAWVSNGFPESEQFEFSDLNEVLCQATFLDLQILFTEDNLWYPGANACTTCHHSNLAVASALMDLSSYSGIIAGSRRPSVDAVGDDILGDGVWEQSKLYEQLFVTQIMPLGRPEGVVPEEGPTVHAGFTKPVP
jgi:hypothetical protein